MREVTDRLHSTHVTGDVHMEDDWNEDSERTTFECAFLTLHQVPNCHSQSQLNKSQNIPCIPFGPKYSYHFPPNSHHFCCLTSEQMSKASGTLKGDT